MARPLVLVVALSALSCAGPASGPADAALVGQAQKPAAAAAVAPTNPQMLDELPEAVLESRRSRAAFGRRYAGDGLVESHVRFFPGQQPNQLCPERIGG